MHVSLPTLALLLAARATASYVLEDDYSSSSFASMFDFYTGADPTNGYVNYVTQDVAQSSGLYKIDNGAVYMGVDSTNVASGSGRDSIRISSKKSYNHGLIILDLAHMPAGACGTWPAFWLLGPDWPNNGEIDIIEGVNDQTTNNMAMHTSSGCTITNTGAFSGSLETDNCDVNAAGQADNTGCSIRSGDSSSFGSGFNADNGGVYATEWTSEAISIWFFPRGSIPSDISSGNPDPSGWGLPQGQFTGGCDIDDKIKNQQIVFDVTFCGDWAGNVWSTDATCSGQASTCQDFVQNTPSAFQDTYWLINSLKVYSANGATSNPTQTTQTLGQSTSAAATSNAASTENPTTTAAPSEAATSVLSTLQTAYTTTAVLTTAPVETETATAPAATAPAATPTQVPGVSLPWGNGQSWNTAGGSGWSDWANHAGQGWGGGRWF